ncbi:MAG: glycoside hydrolase family 3 C-terminal domain-containing protein [Bacteroidales bacterium]|nr:glycoside hydrolase family 3 C-terminal domain-containing protein [Bacteroidales bacterium]
MIRTILTTFALTVSIAAMATIPYGTISKEDHNRAVDLVRQMTLEEKCTLISGQVGGFQTFGIERLGIPAVKMSDGPQGVRNDTRSTYYPCGMSVAASFNRSVAKGVGSGIGCDARARGVGFMLCPGVNIYRSASCGRNFEYFGEDPYLAAETAASLICGIQEQGVISTIKHFAVNNQEYDRHGVSSSIDERTANEIYFAAFRAAVEKARVGAVMTSYNPVNGVHAAESPWLIKDNLRAWGHQGIVMSDWTSTYSTIGCVTGGLDLEMPRGRVMNYSLIKPLIDNGVIDEKDIDLKCVNILQTIIAFGFLDRPMKDSSIPEDYEYSREMAMNAAVEGPVMLLNEGALPIRSNRRNDIVVLGPNADVVPYGGGSGEIFPIEGRSVSLLAAMQSLGKGYKVRTMDWKNVDAASLAKATAVIFAGGYDKRSEAENRDKDYRLPDGQDEAIKAIAAINPNVTVVINTGGEFDLNAWKDDVKAIILAWYGGQAGGPALADIISGKVSPSGRLPFTFWGSLEKNPAFPHYGINTDKKTDYKPHQERYAKYPFTQYSEGIFIGYRGEDKFGVKPLFPFGYGLTYSRFEYSDISVTPSDGGFDVSFKLTNTGKFKASEVAQVYVAPIAPNVLRPTRELKGYDKVTLAPGESRICTVHLPGSAFAYYSPAIHGWKTDNGNYDIQVGRNADGIVLSKTVVL